MRHRSEFEGGRRSGGGDESGDGEHGERGEHGGRKPSRVPRDIEGEARYAAIHKAYCGLLSNVGRKSDKPPG